MHKFIPIALLAIFMVGCKGGETTAATTGGGGSAPAAANKTYTLKLSPKQGDKFNYVMKVDGGPDQQMEMDVSMLCEKVEGDNSTLVMSLEGMKMNGQEPPAAVLEAMTKAKTTMVMDSTGKTLSTKSDNPGPAQSFAGASLPANPVKVGDEWEGVSGADGKETKAKYKFTKVETVGGKEIAVFEVTPESMDSVTLDGPIIVKVDTTNGMTHSMSMKGKTTGADGKESTVSMEMMPK